MVEDGLPRLDSEVVQLRKVTSSSVGADRELAFTGLSTVRYRVTDSGVISWFETKTATSADDVTRVFPQLTDDRAGIQQMSLNWTIRVTPHGQSWRISSYENRWDWTFVGL